MQFLHMAEYLGTDIMLYFLTQQSGKIYLDDGTNNGKMGTYVTHAVITAQTSTAVTITNIGNAVSATFAAVQPTDNAIFIVTHSLSGEGTVAPGAGADNLEMVYNTC